jgi:uncharacterized protein YggL (DUF469 family)
MITTVRNAHFKKKRLRKKYRQGEFAELGFSFEAEWEGDFTDIGYDRVCVTIFDIVEKLKLDCGGSFGPLGVSIIISKYKGSCTQDDINMFTKLVMETGYVKNIKTSNLIDTWYGEF